ncbi:Atx1 cytosolic copper metallochaperone [Candida orthopsilosis Co 90-125]|uniref:Atx1 cytosolic copper metallochaperone n=1 Tax=Candida orthopsilosis (strain 90-125) TaxID=1136231 RepID=H8X5E1_CANO9|nr:Atx1 cytosolic copper metallochaperone [Candida orthopsilosis Co 90-125]CCG23397.1 Atx1 cytosolic copper metallochaperone [Candida orthopsilosis Co 90-125]
MPHKYHFDVTMSCSGCSGAIERVLKKQDGITNYNVSLENQTVDVETDKDYDSIYSVIQKTGKKINGGKVVS